MPFRNQLPFRWQPVAKSLYHALRNGLVHHYDPKQIIVDGRRVECFVSWRERPHLSLEDARVYLNVQQMAIDLRRAFDDYDRALRADARLRDEFSIDMSAGYANAVRAAAPDAERWPLIPSTSASSPLAPVDDVRRAEWNAEGARRYGVSPELMHWRVSMYCLNRAA